MKAHQAKLTVEALEDRCLPSTMVEANFNNDAYMDKVEITSPSTITVSLGSADGYIVSAVLSVSQKESLNYISVYDYDNDGNMDLYASSPAGGNWTNYHQWSGNGDGTFDFLASGKWRWPAPPGHTKYWV